MSIPEGVRAEAIPAGPAARPMPRVAVVVLNLCQEELTRPCLESLLSAGYPELEVVLVDNGSPDGSGERLRRAFPDVSYVQTGENLGFTGGNNRGFRRALASGADYVLALNNDTVVEPGAVGRLVRTAEEGERVGGVCPTITYHVDPDRIWYGGGAFSRHKGLGVHWDQGRPAALHDDLEPREVTFLTGCALLLPAPVLDECGGFAPEFFIYAEDAELSLRLRRAGYRLIHEPRARIQHKKPLDESMPSPFAIRHRDRNRRRIMRRHFGVPARLGFWAWFWPTRVVRILQYLIRGDLGRARAILRGAFER